MNALSYLTSVVQLMKLSHSCLVECLASPRGSIIVFFEEKAVVDSFDLPLLQFVLESVVRFLLYLKEPMERD